MILQGHRITDNDNNALDHQATYPFFQSSCVNARSNAISFSMAPNKVI